MDDVSQNVSTIWIPNLKSLLAIFVGLFCVLCFKKLIGFGRRWRDIIVDWGYRSMNVPSLWIPDALTNSANSRDKGPSIHLGLNVESAKKRFRRLPALRLPEAWPNFLLTWMYLNLSTIFSLVPAWIMAINEELVKATTICKDSRGQMKSRSKRYRLELLSLLPDSMPPRLSSVETSASGSTKELHFRCTFTSPCVSLRLELGVPEADPLIDEPRRTSYILRLQQNACRVQLICAALEGGYVLLSWKLISPLIVNRLSLLTPELTEETELTPMDARWIKDTMYQAIQCAVPRLILSPFCVTPVQKLTADHAFKPQHISDSGRITTYANDSKVKHLPKCDCLSRPSQKEAKSVLIRLVSAILLEPLEDNWLSVLRLCSWRCQLRSNGTPVPGLEVAHECQPDQSTLLATTPAAHLRSRPWPTETPHSGKQMYPSVLQPLDASSTFVVVWNFDTFVPTKRLNSDLLDVVLYTDPDCETGSALRISGHAVLPLFTSSECCAHNQHVVLVDCHLDPSNQPTGLHHSLGARSTSVGTGQPSIKFMLTLKIERSSADFPDLNSATNESGFSQWTDWLGKNASSASTPQSHGSTPAESVLIKSSPAMQLLNTTPSCERAIDPLSPEQVSDFMSKPTSAFDAKVVDCASLRQRSLSFGTDASVNLNSPSPQKVIKESGLSRLESNNSHCRDYPQSPIPIHGTILNPQPHSAGFRVPRLADWDWLDPPPSPRSTEEAISNVHAVSEVMFTPPKRRRRFLRFRSNTSSFSHPTRSSRDHLDSAPTSNGISNFVEGFIEPSTIRNTEEKDQPPNKRHHFGSRLQRLFRRSLARRRKSYEHMASSQSLEHHLANSGSDSHSVY